MVEMSGREAASYSALQMLIAILDKEGGVPHAPNASN